MRIVLVNPNPMKPPVTPVALDYIGSACTQAGIDVDLVDCSIRTDWRDILAKALDDRPILIGVTVRNIDDSYFASRDFSLKRIIPVINEVKQRTDVPVCIGGVGYSIFPQDALLFCDATFGIHGDGETTLVELVHALAGKADFRNVPGLIWKENNRLHMNPAAKVDLETMDLSSRALVDNLAYFKQGGQVGFETKRGCALDCIYCPEPGIKGRQVRCRNPKNVSKELLNLYQQGITVFHTCDSEFNSPAAHGAQVCQAFIDSGLGDKIKWYAYCCPESFTEELAVTMKKSGCVGIDFGADHGDDNMLKRLGRRYNSNELTRIRQVCRDLDMACMFDLLLGSPGETRDTIEKAISLMKTIQPDRVGISLGIRLYPITRLGRKISEGLDGNFLQNPNLFGRVDGNASFLRPIYYCDASSGEDLEDWLHDLIGDDPRFLLGRRTDAKLDYNYNDNPALAQAIRNGHRGAYWDILRRIAEGMAPLTE